MLQLILEADCDDVRRRAIVAHNQQITVGRSEWADFSLRCDRMLHEQHFAVVGAGSEFRLIVNTTAGGAALNGRPVSESLLSCGDSIVAGMTRFRVTLRGRNAIALNAINCSPRWKIEERQCESGLWATTCSAVSIDDFSLKYLPAPCHLILDRKSHPEFSRHTTAASVFLPGQPDAGPFLISPAALADTRRLLRKEWKTGAVVAVLSFENSATLLAMVRNLPASYSDADLLMNQLEHGPKIFARFLVSNVHSILLKQPQSDHWILYSAGSLKAELTSRLDAEFHQNSGRAS